MYSRCHRFLLTMISILGSRKQKEFIRSRLLQNYDALSKNIHIWIHASSVGEVNLLEQFLQSCFTPFVIETSIGVDRMFLSVMCHSFEEEKLDNGETRVVLKLPAALAPVKLAVLPLVKKDGLPEKAREIIDELKFHFNCQYDEKDSIGKRYRRQDAIGTPYCVTVDFDSLQDDSVTIRFRDSMEQKRVKISELRGIIEDNVTITSLLKKLK